MSVLLPLPSLSWDTVNVIFQSKVYSGSHDLMQKPIVLMMLQLFLLKGMITESIFGIWVKMKQ